MSLTGTDFLFDADADGRTAAALTKSSVFEVCIVYSIFKNEMKRLGSEMYEKSIELCQFNEKFNHLNISKQLSKLTYSI
jgi:hypothetical protein